MQSLPVILELIGLFAVGLCFLFLMPMVGQTLVVLSGIVFGEQAYSKFKGQPSGTDMGVD